MSWNGGGRVVPGELSALVGAEWPGDGRVAQQVARALAKECLDGGLSEAETRSLVEEAAEVGRDLDPAARGRALDELRAGVQVMPLAELIGEGVVEQFRRRLNGSNVLELRPRQPVGRDASPSPRDGVVLLSAARIRPCRMRWAWDGRIPSGMLTLCVGMPGLGKSTLSIELAARATRGELPGDLDVSVDVALATAEDAIAEVVVPRLIAAGADLQRVHIIAVRRQGLEGGLSLPDDVEALKSQLREAGVRLLIIDPVIAHIGSGTNSFKDHDVRLVLAPLARMAEELDVAVLGIVHPNKGETTVVLDRIGGSRAFGAAARSVLLLGADPFDPEGPARILAHAKCNVGPLMPSLRFRIDSRTVQSDGADVPTSAMAWHGEAPGVTADDLMQPSDASRKPAGGRKPSALQHAKDVIAEMLSDGPVPANVAEERLERLGIAESTWKRAKAALGVRSKKSRFDDGWTWEPLYPRELNPFGRNSSEVSKGVAITVDEPLRQDEPLRHLEEDQVVDEPLRQNRGVGVEGDQGVHRTERIGDVPQTRAAS